ncbi:hypothetical protein Q3G72_010764 [Acer saccharum]|nr:hypothetical protein Q3G72_008284 [Acer saccharum]KAK1562364.1 hypothetical protein Q3G72_010764 [Acer saccharum]
MCSSWRGVAEEVFMSLLYHTERGGPGWYTSGKLIFFNDKALCSGKELQCLFCSQGEKEFANCYELTFAS